MNSVQLLLSVAIFSRLLEGNHLLLSVENRFDLRAWNVGVCHCSPAATSGAWMAFPCGAWQDASVQCSSASCLSSMKCSTVHLDSILFLFFDECLITISKSLHSWKVTLSRTGAASWNYVVMLLVTALGRSKAVKFYFLQGRVGYIELRGSWDKVITLPLLACFPLWEDGIDKE